MITLRQVEAVATQTGFRADMVEKVLRLHDVLRRLTEHPMTEGVWLCKGGTALNLLHLDVPRLSVDIDLNWVGSADVEEMKRRRPDFERALLSCCERDGLTPRREPSEHAGGKFRLRYASVHGGTQNLEVDVNYVARVPLLEAADHLMRFPPNSDLRVPTLKLDELAAGKFAALVQRSAARDTFDAAGLLELQPDLIDRPDFRLAFLCFVGGGRSDVRDARKPSAVLPPRILQRDVEPLLRPVAGGGRPWEADLAAWIEGTVSPALDRLLDWSAAERRFLDRLLDDGEIDAETLHDDPAVQERIRKQPMLGWKARHVREHRRNA